MRFTESWLPIGTVLVAMFLPNHSCWARSNLESRLDRLEAMVENQLTVQNLNDLDSFKQQMQEMRGMMEEYQHELELVKQRQDSIYKGKTTGKHAAATISAPSQGTMAKAYEEAKQRPSSEQASYEAAYKLIDLKKYKEAQTALQDFLWRFPESVEVANVHYWLGEIYLSYWHDDKKDQLPLEKAMSSFKTVVTKYPKHNKAVDCLLKLGLTEMERENWVLAKEYLTEVKHQYPESSRAKIAHARLESLQEQGLI